MYNKNRLSGIRRTNQLKNPIDSCVVLSDNWRTFELIQSSVVALAKSQDHRVIYGVFCFLADRQGALANGLHGLNPRNTDNRTHPLICRPALIERLVKDWVQRWNKAQSISESIRQAHLVALVFS